MDWQVACSLVDGGAILQWLQPSFVVSVPSARPPSSHAAARQQSSWRGSGGRFKAGGAGQLDATSSGPPPRARSAHSSAQSLSPRRMLSRRRSRRLSMSEAKGLAGLLAAAGSDGSTSGRPVGSGLVLPTWAAGSADEAAAFFGVCLQRGLPRLAAPEAMADAQLTAAAAAAAASGSRPSGRPSLVHTGLARAFPTAALPSGTRSLSSLLSVRSEARSGVISAAMPGALSALAGPKQQQQQQLRRINTDQQLQAPLPLPCLPPLQQEASDPLPSAQHACRTRKAKGAPFRDRAALRVSISGALEAELRSSELGSPLLCGSPRSGGDCGAGAGSGVLPSGSSSPKQLSRMRRSLRGSGATRSVCSSGLGLGGGGDGGAGHWAGGGWGTVHEGGTPLGTPLYDKRVNRLQVGCAMLMHALGWHDVWPI